MPTTEPTLARRLSSRVIAAVMALALVALLGAAPAPKPSALDALAGPPSSRFT